MHLRVVGSVAATGLAALLLTSLWWGYVNTSNKLPLNLIGQVAPDLTVAALDGRDFVLADFRGTPLVVNFWASWCVPCRQEAPDLNAAARKYLGRIQFLGVDIQDTDSAARAYQADVMSPYPVGPLIKGDSHHWGVTAPPETYFINRAGMVNARVLGPVDRQRLEVYISQLAP